MSACAPAVAVEIALGFPMCAHPCINTVDGVFFGNKPFSWYRKVPLTLVTCGLALLVAILVEDVSFIFSLTGATASTAVCFILPAAFLLRTTPVKGWRNAEKLGAVGLLVVGVLIMVISTTVTIINGPAD
jgi:amino acid permease